MKKVFIEAGIYYDVEQRECFAVMDELKCESPSLYTGTLFVLVMYPNGSHDMIHESRLCNKVYLHSFKTHNAKTIKRLLFDLSFFQDLRDKRSYVKGMQILYV